MTHPTGFCTVTQASPLTVQSPETEETFQVDSLPVENPEVGDGIAFDLDGTFLTHAKKSELPGE